MAVRRTCRIRRTTVALVAVGVLGTVPLSASAAAPSTGPAPATALEQRAARTLGEIRLAQAAFDRREHLGRPSATTGPSACSERLAEAWQWLGHFSDGLDTYLMSRPPCRVSA